MVVTKGGSHLEVIMSSKDMTRYEYAAIRRNLDGNVQKLRFFDADGNHRVSDIQDPHKEIAKLGSEGQKLVTLTELTSSAATVYYLKRLVE